MQRGFYFDQSRCIGCYACVIACKDWYEYDLGSEPANWIKLTNTEKGRFPDISLSYLFSTCLHCAEPSCVDACPVEAIYKRSEDGIVLVDRELCLGKDGCGALCESACHTSAP